MKLPLLFKTGIALACLLLASSGILATYYVPLARSYDTDVALASRLLAESTAMHHTMEPVTDPNVHYQDQLRSWVRAFDRDVAALAHTRSASSPLFRDRCTEVSHTWSHNARPRLMAVIDAPASSEAAAAAQRRLHPDVPRFEAAAKRLSGSLGLYLEGLNRHLRITVIMIGALHIVFLLAALWTTRRIIVVPLKRMRQATRRIAAGGFDAPLTASSGDELGELCMDFNVMAAELQSQREHLSRSELHYRFLAETVPDLIFMSSAEGECAYGNRRWQEFTGIAVNSRNRGWMSAVQADDLVRIEQLWQTCSAERTPLTAECRLVGTDGKERWFLLRVLPQEHEPFDFKWLGVCTDIEDLRSAQAALVQKQKLESIGLLAGGIAHDFNNILVGILGNAALLVEDLGPSSMRRRAEEIVQSAEKIAGLTRQMLAYAGKGKFDIRPVDVNAAVREIAGIAATSFPKTVELKLQLTGDLPAVEADLIQLEQVILNLAINGAEAVPVDLAGCVTIATTLERDPEPVVVFKVTDTGIGMPDEVRDRMFDPFFTTKFTGRGLGLSAVLGIVKAHKASLDVASTPGVGTVITVRFPALERSLSPGKRPQDRPDVKGDGTLMVVDDDDIVRKVTATILRSRGYHVLTAENGRVAVDLFEQRAAEIALVLLDLNMPEMGGEETIRRLRTIDPQVRIVLTSGYSEPEAQDQFVGIDVIAFIQKPWQPSALISAVQAALNNGTSTNPHISVREASRLPS